MKMILNKVLEILGAVLLVGMVAVVLWQVFSRTVLGNRIRLQKSLSDSDLSGLPCCLLRMLWDKSTFSRNGFK